MKSFSQSGQDEFVNFLIPTPGTFLDVGSGGPEIHSNSFGLELIGWRGACVDRCASDYSSRNADYVIGDAIHIDYKPILNRIGAEVVDYLSLDTDENTLQSLLRVLKSEFRFKIITIEHDSYKRGPFLRDSQRFTLKKNGYTLVCSDVCHPDIGGLPFEDWWVDSKFFSQEKLEKAKHDGACFTKIIEDLKS